MTKTRGETFAVLASFWHLAVTACPTYQVSKAVPAFGRLFRLRHPDEPQLALQEYLAGSARLARRRIVALEGLRIQPQLRHRWHTDCKLVGYLQALWRRHSFPRTRLRVLAS